jgi:ankyrin repeat protein
MTPENAAVQFGTHLLWNVKEIPGNCTIERIRQSIKAKGIARSFLILLFAYMGLEQPVLFLLDKGADIETGSQLYRTPLIMAAWRNKENLVWVLLEKGANVNSVDLNCVTPLVSAAAAGHLGIVRLLVEKGADTKLPSNYGRMALQAASSYPAIAEFLKNK